MLIYAFTMPLNSLFIAKILYIWRAFGCIGENSENK